MKNTLYILLIFAFAATSCSKRTIVITEDRIPEDIFYLENEIKPFSGECKIFYPNSENLKELMTFKNGILNGKHISYYKSGQVKREGTYYNGNLNGKWVGYAPDGKKIFEVEYKNDTLIGKFISWYNTGVIREKGSFNNNHKTGEWLSYDEAGMIIKKIALY